MKYIRKISILLLILSVILTGCLKSKEEKIREQLELGQKYLLEENYEEAIVAFTKVIQLEEKEFQAYIGLAEAYTRSGDKEQAETILNQGITVAGGIAEKEKTEEMLQYIEEMQDLVRQLETERQIEELYYEDVQNILQYLEEHDGEPDEGMLMDEEFQSLLQNLNEPWIKEYNGKFIIIYPDGFIYYGDMKDGKREGYGIWMIQGTTIYMEEKYPDFYIFQGTWRDDYPNGDGIEILHVFDPPENTTSYIKKKGGYVDGYLDGNVMSIYIESNGEKHTFYYNIIHGKPVFVEGEDLSGGDGLLANAEEDEKHGLYSPKDFIYGVRCAMKKGV